MSNDSLIVPCPSCGTRNRIPRSRMQDKPVCGKCKAVIPPFPDRPVNVTTANFEREVIQSPLPVLVDFWAEWCGPCKMIAPDLERIAGEYAGRIKIAKVDIDSNQELGARFQIQAVPSLLVFKGGRLIEQQAGALPYPQLQVLVEKTLAL